MGRGRKVRGIGFWGVAGRRTRRLEGLGMSGRGGLQGVGGLGRAGQGGLWGVGGLGRAGQSRLRGVGGPGRAGQGGLGGFRRLRTAGRGGMSGVRRFGAAYGSGFSDIQGQRTMRYIELSGILGLWMGYGGCLGIDGDDDIYGIRLPGTRLSVSRAVGVDQAEGLG